MTRYTVKTATDKFSEYGSYEFSKVKTGYQVSFQGQCGTITSKAKTLTLLVEQLVYHLTEVLPKGQATELTCEYVAPKAIDTTEDEKLNDGDSNDSQAHQATQPVNRVVSLSMWKNNRPTSQVGSKSAKALQKRLAKLGIRQPVAA